MKVLLQSIMITLLVLGCVQQKSQVKSDNTDIFVKLVPGSDSNIQAYVSVPKDTQDVTVCLNDTECAPQSGYSGVDLVTETSDKKILKMQREFSPDSTLTIIRGVSSAVRRIIKLKTGIDIGDISEYLIKLPVVRNTKMGGGSVLDDVVQHYYDENSVSACMGYRNYSDSDSSTYAHEATHGLNACIKNKYSNQGQVYGFYLLNGNAIYVKYPSMSRTKIAGYVPQNLRKANSVSDRFSMYIASTQYGWDTPLYIFDEWTAYSNGAREAIDKVNKGKSTNGFVKLGEGALEFMVYATATGLAIEKNDPSYLQNEPKFLALYKHLATVLNKDIMSSSHNVVVDSEMKQYLERFKTDSSAEAMRTWIKKYCGEQWTRDTFGF